MAGPISGQFSIFPVAGIVPAGHFQLLALRFLPASAGTFVETIPCTINGAESGRQVRPGTRSARTYGGFRARSHHIRPHRAL